MSEIDLFRAITGISGRRVGKTEAMRRAEVEAIKANPDLTIIRDRLDAANPHNFIDGA